MASERQERQPPAALGLVLVLVGIVIGALGGFVPGGWFLVVLGVVASAIGAFWQFRLGQAVDFTVEEAAWNPRPSDNDYTHLVSSRTVRRRRKVSAFITEDDGREHEIILDVSFSPTTGDLLLAVGNPIRVRVHLG